MPTHPFFKVSKANRRTILLLTACHLAWCCLLISLWGFGSLITEPHPLWSTLFVALQLFTAAQLLLPVCMLHPEERGRGFYLFWGVVLCGAVWAANQYVPTTPWKPLLNIFKSGLLLLTATLVGAALARYVNRIWELIPVCVVMTLADFTSWLGGPTAGFAQQIEEFYRAPVGPPPLVDMLLIKLVYPGGGGVLPVFGISDWIMVVFFAVVAQRHDLNDNLVGPPGDRLARKGRWGRYLPVSVLALLFAIILAQTTGLFIPVLPLIALVMLLWHAARSLVSSNTA